MHLPLTSLVLPSLKNNLQGARRGLKALQMIRVTGNGCIDSLTMSAVTQTQPLKVEIKDFKTSHFLEPKTAPRNSPDAGPMGHVEFPESEPANNDLKFKRPSLCPRADP